ncbi:MAG: hypothetical protein AAGF11_38380 [Myxococcota bacterium]
MPTADEQWTLILNVFDEYYERNRDNAEVAAYAHQIQQLAHNCYRQREEAGGWAGEFTRTLLLIGARDTADRAEHWDNPPDAGWRPVCEFFLGDLCGTIQAGGEHFSEHLAPGFYEYIKARLTRVGRDGPPEGAYERIRDDMLAIIDEHKKLIELAVMPAAQNVHEYGAPWFRSLVGYNIGGDASALRRRTLDRIRLELAEEGIITRSQGVQLLSQFSTIPIGF